MKCAEKHLCLPRSLHYHLPWGAVAGRSLARFLSLKESTSDYSQQFTSGPRVYWTTPLFSTVCIIITGEKNYTTLTLKDRPKNGDASTRKKSRQKHNHHLFAFCIDLHGLFATSVPNLTCPASYHMTETCVVCCFATSPVILIYSYLLPITAPALKSIP